MIDRKNRVIVFFWLNLHYEMLYDYDFTIKL